MESLLHRQHYEPALLKIAKNMLQTESERQADLDTFYLRHKITPALRRFHSSMCSGFRIGAPRLAPKTSEIAEKIRGISAVGVQMSVVFRKIIWSGGER